MVVVEHKNAPFDHDKHSWAIFVIIRIEIALIPVTAQKVLLPLSKVPFFSLVVVDIFGKPIYDVGGASKSRGVIKRILVKAINVVRFFFSDVILGLFSNILVNLIIF